MAPQTNEVFWKKDESNRPEELNFDGVFSIEHELLYLEEGECDIVAEVAEDIDMSL